MSQVEWRPVVDFEGLYEVSNAGDVRRIGRAARTGAGHGGGARIGRVLKHQSARGYRRVQLWRDGRLTQQYVHCLVAAAFIGTVPVGQEVNHKDGDKANNCADNLEYLTRSDNNQHAYDTGLREAAPLIGEKHHQAKLTEDDVREIRRRYRPGVYGQPRLAREFEVSVRTIWRIVHNEGWRHVA